MAAYEMLLPFTEQMSIVHLGAMRFRVKQFLPVGAQRHPCLGAADGMLPHMRQRAGYSAKVASKVRAHGLSSLATG
jgi:hypothetical protein